LRERARDDALAATHEAGYYDRWRHYLTASESSREKNSGKEIATHSEPAI
jgi:cyclopropane fatty-acyl-phospholipid synthase-like methyltransferase